jgi:hypothetical protein
MINRISALFASAVTVITLADPSFAGGLVYLAPPVGAPGPIAGAGLSILAIGYGAYWLVKRYRRKTG